mmetsp:Transcript_21431/g.43656  ORF Transcript_21431/g.43656 Transcript_21431/m.43656 type:complete len:243 (-) Transcript_21431:874-1602(-)
MLYLSVKCPCSRCVVTFSKYATPTRLQPSIYQVRHVIITVDIWHVTTAPHTSAHTWHSTHARHTSHATHSSTHYLAHQLLQKWPDFRIRHHFLQFCRIGHEPHRSSRAGHEIGECFLDFRVFHSGGNLRIGHESSHHTLHPSHSTRHAPHASRHTTESGHTPRCPRTTLPRPFSLLLFRLPPSLFLRIPNLFRSLLQLLLLFQSLLHLFLLQFRTLLRRVLQHGRRLFVKINRLGRTQILPR